MDLIWSLMLFPKKNKKLTYRPNFLLVLPRQQNFHSSCLSWTKWFPARKLSLCGCRVSKKSIQGKRFWATDGPTYIPVHASNTRIVCSVFTSWRISAISSVTVFAVQLSTFPFLIFSSTPPQPSKFTQQQPTLHFQSQFLYIQQQWTQSSHMLLPPPHQSLQHFPPTPSPSQIIVFPQQQSKAVWPASGDSSSSTDIPKNIFVSFICTRDDLSGIPHFI